MAGLLGDVEHHQPAMTASLLKRFCRTSRTLPFRPAGRGCKDECWITRQSAARLERRTTLVNRLLPGDQLSSNRARKTGKRSEEHTSELQSLMRISYAVFCLKKKKIKNITKTQHTNRTINNKQYMKRRYKHISR